MFFKLVNHETQIRILEERDAPELFALVDQSRSYLRQWLPFVDSTENVEVVRKFIQTGLQRYAANNGAEFGIWYQGAFAGVIGLQSIDWEARSTTIGYWIGEHFQGNGIMTNTCITLFNFLFRDYGLNRIEIEVAPQNLKSKAGVTRLGLSFEGRKKEALRLDDQYVDVDAYAMLSKDWLVRDI